MLKVIVIILTLLPTIFCAGEGNIRLLEDEVATALKACSETDSSRPQKQKRSADRFIFAVFSAENTAKIDDANKQGPNLYSHERRNMTDRDQISVMNATDYDYDGYGSGGSDKLINSMPKTAAGGSYPTGNTELGLNRTRRNEPLFNKPDNNQCLSQCVFANLQVVDSRGIPREAELWGKVQASVTSQQSRAALRDQIGACFQELQSEAEDNGCSYSNKLERCLMLRFSDRKPKPAGTETKT